MGTGFPLSPSSQPLYGQGSVRLRPTHRRRHGLLLAGVVLIGFGALVGAAAINAVDERRAVLVIAHTVPVGHELGPRDVVVVRIGVDAHAASVPASERDSVVGRTAAVELRAGMLLTPNAVTDHVVPGPGEVLVGVAVTPNRAPARPLKPGDRVLAVETVDSPDAPTAVAAGSAAGSTGVTEATVFDVGEPDSDGTVTVDVTVGRDEGLELARLGAAGRVTLILQSKTGSK